MLSSFIYESLFNSSPTGNYLLSPTPEAIILAVNDAFLAASSRKREDLVGISLFVAFPENPDDPEDTGVAALRNSLVKVIATRQADALPLQRYPIIVIGPNGEERYEERFWSAVSTPIFGPDGQLICISHRTTDVTQQARAEAALRKSEERYRSLFESIDQGFCIVEMLVDDAGDPTDCQFCEVNPAFTKLSELSTAAGKTVRELIPAHADEWINMCSGVAMTGEPLRREYEAKTLSRWFDVYAFRTDEPDKLRVAILFKDITRKKQAEENLRTSERQALDAARQAEAQSKRLDAVLEAVPVGIVVSNADGAISMANTAFKYLWGASHPGAHNIDEFAEWKGWWVDGLGKQGQRLQPHEWTTARVLRGEEALRDIIEIESFDEPSNRRICLNSGAPIRDRQGNIVGAVVAQLDITDRVKAEEALKQADRRKDEFLAMLAHELRNPLAPIAAAADLLELGHPNEARVKQTSAIISRQVKHMTALVDDLLDVSRVTRGLVTLDKIRLDAKRIVSEAVEQVRPLIEARRHRLTVHTPPDPAFVQGDPKRLVQVMTNLLNNAAKYTPEAGSIILDMEVDGDHVRMTVTDNGIGMEADMSQRAFDLFAQAERTSDRSQGGLGIGLALVKSLVELHGGTVMAYSEGGGKGSRFTVCLPHSDGPAGVPAPRQYGAIEPSTGKPLTVMVVDDNSDVAQMLAMFVEALGHHVIVEHSSWRAFERAMTEHPDICLLDIGLPDIDGNALARRLRTEPQLGKTVLVAVTGYGQEQDRQNALNAGFDHHFVKPIDSKKLADLLTSVASLRK
jgi:PAS domain S-box-containing protein